MGGWNASGQFDNVHLLDGMTLTWSQVETASGPDGWGDRRWNFSAVSVFAVPRWKVFVFGGNTGDLDPSRPQGTYRNDLQVMECVSSLAEAPGDSGDTSDDTEGVLSSAAQKWVHPSVAGEIPCPRSDTEALMPRAWEGSFSLGGGPIGWHDDAYVCDVSEVVGPPYNIFTVRASKWNEPTCPVTGGSTMVLLGRGFQSTSNGGGGGATVRFACPRGFLEVPAEVVSDEEASCVAPGFEKFGLQTLEIGYTDATSEGAASLAAALLANESLKELGLAHNVIGDQGVTYLAFMLRENSTLQKLDLCFNMISPAGMNSLASALRENTALQELDLLDVPIGDMSPFVSAMEDNTSLTKLATYPGVDTLWRKELDNALARNKTLQKINTIAARLREQYDMRSTQGFFDAVVELGDDDPDVFENVLFGVLQEMPNVMNLSYFK